MSIYQYMKEVLMNPISGYYMKHEVFGVKGDFITSPEISQMFGELIGIWFVYQWQNLGKPKDVRIVEFGPGRGTLLDDMIRALQNFHECYNSISGIHLIEASPRLREVQREKLNPYIIKNNENREKNDLQESLTNTTYTVNAKKQAIQAGLNFYWHDAFEDVPDGWSMIIAHEFFDALPVYWFELTEKGWSELMIDIDETDQSPYHFRVIISPKRTPSLFILRTHLNNYNNNGNENLYKIGDRIEIAPDAWRVANQIAKSVNKNCGSSLIIDYGKNFVQGNTLRAIKQHKFVDLISRPGEADLSADVNFKLLNDACKGLVDTFGPITQAHFLHSMGISFRLKMLLEKTPPSRHQDLILSYKRLIDPIGMGNVYQVLAITPKSTPNPPAGGFQ
ncbi:13284_t:CDS:2 [Ambispora gerdemannii]|uniref:Protein arginine methyltransferase NDUFAF7 n=1 Tax=Ambispora gerdemannii TaxID=144530 RepID=A0A9N9B2N7_9GLOM|nr:13284_t:CDS:2 [Ambispora gerdemannii]